MAFLKYANNAISTLNATISAIDTSITLASGGGSKFPSAGPFLVTIWSTTYNSPGSDPSMEIIKIASRSGDTLTVDTRAQESTAASAHSAGSYVANLVTAGYLKDQRGIKPHAGGTNAWVTSTVYELGEIVNNDGAAYAAILDHTSGASTEPGTGVDWQTYWGLVVQGSGGGGAVDSVNGQTGVVVLDADDIDDTSTTQKFVTAADLTKLSNLSGTNTGDQTITLTGDVTGSGTGSFAATIAAGVIVNADVNASAGIVLTKLAATTASRALVSDGSGFITPATTTATEIGYVNGVTSAIQTQLNSKQTTDATLTALAAYNTNGILTQTAADTFVGRTITGTANRVSVTNGDGVSGNPALDIGSDVVTLTGTQTLTNKSLTASQITDFTEVAQDSTGSMVDTTLVYTDGTPLLSRAALTGDVTAPAGSNSTTIANDAVTNAKLANMAQNTIKGRITGSTGDPEDLTATNVRTIINVEDGADVTDATNVAAAGAVMESDTSTASMSFVIDEDNMASNSATKVPTQQSVKAYVDASGGGASDFTDLGDVPASYTGQGNKIVSVKADETGLEFVSVPGGGDMLASVYDPQVIEGDAFDVDNHTNGTTNKVFTATEQAKLAGIEDGAEVNTVDSVNGQTDTVVLDADDIDDTSTTQKFVTAADLTKLSNLSGTNTGDQTITLTGNVTGSGTGSFATTIANDAVTFARMQNITTDTLVGRDTASSGDPEEITVGGGIEFTGSSSLQRSALTGDITASAGSNTTAIASGVIVNADVNASAAIALSKLAATTVSRALVSDGSGFVSAATTTATEIGYVNGVTSAIQTQLNAKAPLASPTFTGTVTLPTGLTGVLRADSGVVSTDSDVTDLVTAASTTAQGKVEIAIASELNTGTDATRAVSPDALAGSNLGIRYFQLVCYDWTTDIATGDGKYYMHITPALTGMNLVYVHAFVVTAGTTGTTDIQIANVTDAVDMLSTKLTIDSTETGSNTAATPAVINTSTDDVATNDVLRIDIDAASTTKPKGLVVTLGFQLP